MDLRFGEFLDREFLYSVERSSVSAASTCKSRKEWEKSVYIVLLIDSSEFLGPISFGLLHWLSLQLLYEHNLGAGR